MRATLDLLRRAREILSDPGHWTKGHLALNARGDRSVLVQSRHAVRFCSIGAVWRAEGRDLGYAPPHVVDAFVLLEAEMPHGVASFNDCLLTTHADVLNAFDRAITVAEKRCRETEPLSVGTPESTEAVELVII